MDRYRDLESAPTFEAHLELLTWIGFDVHVIRAKSWVQAESHLFNKSISSYVPASELDKHGPLVSIALVTLCLAKFMTITVNKLQVAKIARVGIFRP